MANSTKLLIAFAAGVATMATVTFLANLAARVTAIEQFLSALVQHA